jgi:alkylation response protein AidB-like acyl-CoA dehydrogenase
MNRFQALNPHARHPVLDAIEAYLEAPETRAELESLDRERRYPHAALERLRALGLPALLTEAATVHHLTALNVLCARASGSLAITVGVNALALLPVYIAADDEQRARIFARVREGAASSMLLTELDHGSNLLACQAGAEPGTVDGGAFRPGAPGTHYRLRGEKHLINGGREHALLMTFLRTQAAGGPGDFSFFAIERDPTVIPLARHRTLPAAGADISGVRFDDTIVDHNCLLGREGEGFTLVQKTLSISRGAISGLACGAASRAHELAAEHARSWWLYGAPIAQLGAIAEHLRRLDALELAVAAIAVKQTALVNAQGLAAAHHTAVAKLAACTLAEAAVDEGRRVLAARALLHDLPYARLVRDVLLYGVFDGTRHVMLDQIQWRLTQVAAASDETEDTLTPLRAAYAAAPAPLVEVLRRRGRARAPALLAHLRALQALPGAVALVPLTVLGETLVAAVRTARADGRWDADQALRFEAAELLALLETLIAVVELADPDRRLGAADVVSVETYRFTLAWLGASLAARMRLFVRTAGQTPPPALDEAEAQLVASRPPGL